jgi:hypothetical protein
MTKPRVKTGDKRAVNRPLNIDRLPPHVHDAILQLKNQLGKTWDEIEALSAEEFKQDGKGGFIDWESLPTDVLELFPNLRLPHSSLHRWYDLRVSQVTREAIARTAQAREIAATFSKAIVGKQDEAVINAATAQLMGLLAEDASPKARISATRGLIVLAEVMQSVRANTIKERKVAVDERKLKALEAREELSRRKLEQETENAAKKLGKGGEVTLEDLNRLRERTFGLPPVSA